MIRRNRTLLWLACCALLFGTSAMAAEFLIQDVQIVPSEQLYQLSAQVDYRLSETALEALGNGVPLTLNVTLMVEKVWRKFWEERLLQKRLSYQIRYHALTELYRVVDQQTGDDQHFVTQEAAIHALGELQKIPLVAEDDLEPGVKYQLKMRAELDIESLPLPLRPLAYLGKGWRLTSGWTLWPLSH